MGEYLGVGAGWQRHCAVYCVVGGISSELVFPDRFRWRGRIEELVDISLFFLVHLGFAVSWIDSGQCYGLLPLLYPYFCYGLDLLLGDCISDMVLRRQVLGGFGNVSHLSCLGSPWVPVLEASFLCALAVFFYSFGVTGGLGFGKAFGKHLGAWRAKRCVVCWVCSQRRAQTGSRSVQVASFWGAGRRGGVLINFCCSAQGAVVRVVSGVERVGWAPPPSLFFWLWRLSWPCTGFLWVLTAASSVAFCVCQDVRQASEQSV